MVRLKEAAAQLGVTDCALVVSNKYKAFHIKTDNRRISYFDLEGYQKKADLDNEIKQKVTLFIEYLVHMEKITYSFIAKATGVYVQSVSNHDFSPLNAEKILTWFRYNRPFHVKRFDIFYGYPVIELHRRIKLKVSA